MKTNSPISRAFNIPTTERLSVICSAQRFPILLISKLFAFKFKHKLLILHKIENENWTKIAKVLYFAHSTSQQWETLRIFLLNDTQIAFSNRFLLFSIKHFEVFVFFFIYKMVREMERNKTTKADYSSFTQYVKTNFF